MKKEDIEQLAVLARIQLRDGEADALASDITSIVGYVSEIDAIAGDHTAAKKVGAHANVLREDGDPHEAGIYTEDLLNAAPTRKGAYLQVKKILGGDA